MSSREGNPDGLGCDLVVGAGARMIICLRGPALQTIMGSDVQGGAVARWLLPAIRDVRKEAENVQTRKVICCLRSGN